MGICFWERLARFLKAYENINFLSKKCNYRAEYLKIVRWKQILPPAPALSNHFSFDENIPTCEN
jgi:hypothetical protein